MEKFVSTIKLFGAMNATISILVGAITSGWAVMSWMRAEIKLKFYIRISRYQKRMRAQSKRQ